MALFLWEDMWCSRCNTSGNPLLSLLASDYIDQILGRKKHYSIFHLMPSLHSLYDPTFTFSTFFSQFFASYPILSPSVSPGPVLSRRESFISRMKALSLFDCVRKVMTVAHHRLLSIVGCCWSFHSWPFIKVPLFLSYPYLQPLPITALRSRTVLSLSYRDLKSMKPTKAMLKTHHRSPGGLRVI